jgi:hypothetical protein
MGVMPRGDGQANQSATKLFTDFKKLDSKLRLTFGTFLLQNKSVIEGRWRWGSADNNHTRT